jgi:hypothetical protein
VQAVQPPDVAAKGGAAIVVDTPASDGKPGEPAAQSVVPSENAAAEIGAALLAVSTPSRIPKLEPVVPVITTRPVALTVKKITTGVSSIDIHTNQPVTDYKVIGITAPSRLVIDIAGEKIHQKPRSVAINRFGVSRARIGVSPNNIRIVFDSDKAGFPAHTITTLDEGVRITFR